MSIIGQNWCRECRGSTAGVCGLHSTRTITVGPGATLIPVDFYDYETAADKLIRQLGWDDSDSPEVIAALKAARAGVQP